MQGISLAAQPDHSARHVCSRPAQPRRKPLMLAPSPSRCAMTCAGGSSQPQYKRRRLPLNAAAVHGVVVHSSPQQRRNAGCRRLNPARARGVLLAPLHRMMFLAALAEVQPPKRCSSQGTGCAAPVAGLGSGFRVGCRLLHAGLLCAGLACCGRCCSSRCEASNRICRARAGLDRLRRRDYAYTLARQAGSWEVMPGGSKACR